MFSHQSRAAPKFYSEQQKQGSAILSCVAFTCTRAAAPPPGVLAQKAQSDSTSQGESWGSRGWGLQDLLHMEKESITWHHDDSALCLKKQ